MDGRVSAGGRMKAAARGRGLGAEVGGFALAGGCAYAVDVGLFIWLRGPAGLDPLTAKGLSFVAGCAVAYAGNALGPYRAQGGAGARARWCRIAVFFLVNLAGAGVQLACLGLSHYGFGFTSARADVIAGAGVGMALATVLRFWGTRTLVFRTPEGTYAAAGTYTATGGRTDPAPAHREQAPREPARREQALREPAGSEPTPLGPTSPPPP